MCSCLKQLPYGFADRAGAVCKKGGGGGGKGRVEESDGSRTHESLPEQEVGILLRSSPSPSPTSELLRSRQKEPRTRPRSAMSLAGLWVAAVGKYPAPSAPTSLWYKLPLMSGGL